MLLQHKLQGAIAGTMQVHMLCPLHFTSCSFGVCAKNNLSTQPVHKVCMQMQGKHKQICSLPAEIRQGLLCDQPGQGEADCDIVFRQEDPVRRPDQHNAPGHHPRMAGQEGLG